MNKNAFDAIDFYRSSKKERLISKLKEFTEVGFMFVSAGIFITCLWIIGTALSN